MQPGSKLNGINMSDNKPKIDQTLMDLVRRVTPSMIAQEINGVQPMVAPKHWRKVLDQFTNGKILYWIHNDEIKEWIAGQPAHMWELRKEGGVFTQYEFTKEMESWFLLRWS